MNPFNVAKQIGDNFGSMSVDRRDKSAIDDILQKASSTGNPKDVENAMNQILSRVSPERQTTALAILQNKQKQLLSNQERDRIKASYTGSGLPEGFIDLDPQVQKQMLQQQKEQNDRKRKGEAYQASGYSENEVDLDPRLQVQREKQNNYNQGMDRILGNNNNQPESGQVFDPIQGFKTQSSQGRPTLQQSNTKGQPKTLNDATDEQLQAIVGLGGPNGKQSEQILRSRQEDRKIEQSEKAIEQKKEEGKIKRHTDISQKILEKSENIAEQIPQKRTALNLMNDAISRKDLSFWSKDNLAELTGIEGLRSPEGALFKTAGKEYFLGNLSRAGARPNQWIEQQIADMMTKVGRSTEANLSVTRALENELDLDEERVRLTESISNDLEKRLGYIPRDLGNRVNSELKTYSERRQKELFNDLRAIKSIGEGKTQTFGKVETGTPVSKVVAKALLKQFNNDPKRAAEEAKKLGYSF